MKFIYLIQGDGRPVSDELPPGADYLYLQWQKDFVPGPNTFHYPNSSWASGRNELYRRASRQGPYDYFIFLDDDVSFQAPPFNREVVRLLERLVRKGKPVSAWRHLRAYLNARRHTPGFAEMERLLEKHQPPIAGLRMWGHPWSFDASFNEIDAVTYFDHLVAVVHRTAADVVLPWSTRFDDIDWNQACEIFSESAFRNFSNQQVRFSRLLVWNGAARSYPNTKDGRRAPQHQVLKPELSPVSPPTEAARIGEETALVVTSIAASTPSLDAFGELAAKTGARLTVMGDEKSPADVAMPNADYWPIARQLEMPFRLAKSLPRNGYARKNLAYLVALSDPRTRFIVESDDDNAPMEAFGHARNVDCEVQEVREAGWHNVYSAFTHRKVWPRGFALNRLLDRQPEPVGPVQPRYSPVQQGLAHNDPDVDAIFRLTDAEPVNFRDRSPVMLGRGVWCPFNSQNTTWAVEVAEMMYLPAHCPMRETDIWRGLIAQRLLWELDSGVVFHNATVHQDRNEHDLIEDLRQERRLNSESGRVADILMALDLQPGTEAIGANLLRCHEAMITANIFVAEERDLAEAWLDDVAEARKRALAG